MYRCMFYPRVPFWKAPYVLLLNLWGVKGEKRRFAYDWVPSQGSFNYNLRFL
ncbi:hypothetical protein KC19_11G147800 [Ceratodon purpureus]|uniref:Uncharacterized protein n=1 Tax=Ceratodon purpureus TaxID=3225 RepID=A0A8T0GGA9_CERPU|nr:hypothetical protein KC19_11G147800 [Ceratodon purpureus]